jgi:hypothetical protein
MEAGAKASTPVADAATVSIAERRASEDSQPPAGASGWEHDDVEVVGDEAAVAIDALILLASRAPRETSVKRRRRARPAAATGALLPANARSPKDAEDQSGGWSPAAGNEKASPQVSGPGSSPEPLPGIAARPAQPGGASDQHVSQGGQASQGSRKLPAIAELQLPTPLLPRKTVQATPGCIQHLLSGRIDMSHASDGSARCPTTDGGGHLVAETAEPQRGAQAKDDAKLTSATVDTKVTELVSGGQKEAHSMEDGTSSPSKKQVRATTCPRQAHAMRALASFSARGELIQCSMVGCRLVVHQIMCGIGNGKMAECRLAVWEKGEAGLELTALGAGRRRPGRRSRLQREAATRTPENHIAVASVARRRRVMFARRAMALLLRCLRPRLSSAKTLLRAFFSVFKVPAAHQGSRMPRPHHSAMTKVNGPKCIGEASIHLHGNHRCRTAVY